MVSDVDPIVRGEGRCAWENHTPHNTLLCGVFSAKSSGKTRLDQQKPMGSPIRIRRLRCVLSGLGIYPRQVACR